MERRRTDNLVSVMYSDADKKRSLEEKLSWMKSRYQQRVGLDPKVALVHQDNMENVDELLGMIIIQGDKALQPNYFVLCQTPEDYFAEPANTKI